jgi:hypothetical protein
MADATTETTEAAPTTTIEARTKTGMTRVRGGQWIASTWAPYEVTAEQLAEIEADTFLELRQPGLEARAEQATQALAQVDEQADRIAALEAELAARTGELSEARATIATLEADLASAHELLDELQGEPPAPAPAPPAKG